MLLTRKSCFPRYADHADLGCIVLLFIVLVSGDRLFRQLGLVAHVSGPVSRQDGTLELGRRDFNYAAHFPPSISIEQEKKKRKI